LIAVPPNEEAAVQEQRLGPKSGQSERLESTERQQCLIAMSPNKEAVEVHHHDMELESAQLGLLMWSACERQNARLGSDEHSRIGASRTR